MADDEPQEPDILSLMARPVYFHPVFLTLTKSVDAAIMLSQAFHWLPKITREDGWFYKTRVEWHEETGLSRSAQETARKRLRDCDFWTEERRGNPAQMFYKLDRKLLNKALLQMAGFQPSKDGAVLTNKVVGLRPTPRARPTLDTEKTTRIRQEKPIRKDNQNPPFQSELFLSALSDFEEHRKEMKKALQPTGRKRLYEKLEVFGERVATQALKESVENGWVGVFPPKTNGNGYGNGAKDEYRGPVASKRNPKRDNCQQCFGTGTILDRSENPPRARVCNHEVVVNA